MSLELLCCLIKYGARARVKQQGVKVPRHSHGILPFPVTVTS
jgi:hypothetical protein